MIYIALFVVSLNHLESPVIKYVVLKRARGHKTVYVYVYICVCVCVCVQGQTFWGFGELASLVEARWKSSRAKLLVPVCLFLLSWFLLPWFMGAVEVTSSATST